MRGCLNRLFVAVSAAVCAAPLYAQPDAPPIRLRSGTFVPAMNVGRAAPRGDQQLAGGGRRHMLIQFSGPVTVAELAVLRRAGAVPLRYVPDNAMSVSVPPGFDAGIIPGARWIGTLRPGDKLSDEISAELARGNVAYPLTAIEFHADVATATIDGTLAAAGTSAVPARSLPRHLVLIPTDRLAIARLAAQDAVAWIYPAPADVAGGMAPVCEGLAHPAGIVAEFATVGDGWDGPGGSGASLTYFVSRTSGDLDPAMQLGELTRAMAEWSRHIAVDWQPAAEPHQPASVNVLWGPAQHGDAFPFEPQVLAHAFYPASPMPEPIAGDVHFNDTHLWGTSDPSTFDVFSVALHELGHSLGLAHSGNPDAVMYPIYRGIVTGLGPPDIATALKLYAPALAPLPNGWNAAAIGGSLPGAIGGADGRFTIESGGRDIWDSSDEFRFVWRPLDGDGDIVARVDGLTGMHRWAKAGVMIRASEDPGAAHAFALVSLARGIAFQRRRGDGLLSVSTDGGPGSAPQWLWLSRRGARVSAYVALDGGAWRLIGADTIALGRTVLAGLAVTSHDVASTATAWFSGAAVTRAPWTGTDVGDAVRAGWWEEGGERIRVRGAGADIWGSADAFHFVWRPLEGDGRIVARVASVQYTRSWAKAGVMIRASLDAGAPHAFMLVSAGKGYAFQRRPFANGPSVHTSGGTGTAPAWVKLERAGDRLSAYLSADGLSWEFVGADVIPMAQTVMMGLAVTSHEPTVMCEAWFDGVAVSTGAQEIRR